MKNIMIINNFRKDEECITRITVPRRSKVANVNFRHWQTQDTPLHMYEDFICASRGLASGFNVYTHNALRQLDPGLNRAKQSRHSKLRHSNNFIQPNFHPYTMSFTADIEKRISNRT